MAKASENKPTFGKGRPKPEQIHRAATPGASPAANPAPGEAGAEIFTSTGA
jgi:hypothetical protein